MNYKKQKLDDITIKEFLCEPLRNNLFMFSKLLNLPSRNKKLIVERDYNIPIKENIHGYLRELNKDDKLAWDLYSILIDDLKIEQYICFIVLDDNTILVRKNNDNTVSFLYIMNDEIDNKIYDIIFDVTKLNDVTIELGNAGFDILTLLKFNGAFNKA